MTRTTVAGGAFAVLLVLVVLILAVGRRDLEQHRDPARTLSPAIPPSNVAETPRGFLYGRVTTAGGTSYEGRLRWGGNEEAFWGDYFNGSKDENPWATHVPPDRLTERRPFKILGFKIADRERPIDLGRPFMARFGDIARVEARDGLTVTLKSGAVFELDRFDASDFDDGVRVWDGRRGVVDLDARQIRIIELFPAARPGAAPDRLHGTVRTRQGDFTGFIQWNRRASVGADELDGHTADGELSLRFDTIGSIARLPPDSCRVTLLDGGEIVLSDARDVSHGHRGIFVDDRRYGRVLVSWDGFESVEFSRGGRGPSFNDFPPGSPLTGSVTTRGGNRLVGRLVYDLDESETTETLDAPSENVNYSIPFGLIASVVSADGDRRDVQRARVTLHDGEELQLERAGDLGEGNAGMLIFVDGRQRPEYVPWSDVQRVDFDRPATMNPPSG